MQINILTVRSLAPIATAMIAATSLLAGTRNAHANPRPLPFTYPAETLPEDSLEVEQYVDYTPLRASEQNADGSEHRVWDGFYRLQTELEYGITDRLELGTYLQFEQSPSAGDPNMRFDGVKERLRYHFLDDGPKSLGMAGYFELAEFHDEFEIEEKLIVSKRLGNLRLMTNLWVEQEFERGKKGAFVYNPTVGATYQITERVFLGIEYWARGRLHHDAEGSSPEELAIDDFNFSTHHYLGPALSLQFGRLWWSLAPYYRLDHAKRSAEVGDQYGKLWVRSVIGLDL